MTESIRNGLETGDAGDQDSGQSSIARLELIYDRFESAWAKTPFPNLREYLSEAGDEIQTALLLELIQIDMERRWRTDASPPSDDPLPARPSVADYVSTIPECRCLDDVPTELLIAEFRIRHQWGDRPDTAVFLEQFPERFDELKPACDDVLSDLAMQPTQNFIGRRQPMSSDPTPENHEPAVRKTPGQSYRSLSEGMQISHYLLRRQIGKGGFGVVFEAVNLDRPYQQCAIKLIRPDRIARPKLTERFKQEITALSTLSHPNIACASDHGEWQGVVYLVLEYVDGVSMSRLVRRKPGMSVADVCELVRQAAIGLQHLHEMQRTHRDIKPSNLMVTSDGTVKILDLGMARLTDIEDQEERLTSIGDVMGTPDYMAPEQWHDSSQVDIRGDVYSLGCTLYCLLSGRPPFADTKQLDPVALMRAHTEASIPDVSAQREDVPEAVRRLIVACMAKKPEDRPATPQEVANQLAPHAAEAKLADLTEHADEAEPFALPESAKQTIVEPTRAAVDQSADKSGNETMVETASAVPGEKTAIESNETDSGSSDLSGEETVIERPGTQQADVQPDESSMLASAASRASSTDTLIESATATKIPSLEETLIQQGIDPTGTLAEQTIKPQGPTTASGSQRSGSSSPTSRSYSARGSVVLTPRQVTYGKVSGVANAEYEIGKVLGQGGMGAVYRARQGSVDRGVALKMVRKDQATADAQDKFLAEAVVTGALEHPNIVPIYDLGVNASDELFYAMKEVQGHAWTDSIDKVSLDENLDVITKVTDAIAFAHEKGIVHRDLKPDNIMIGEFGEVVVMDWGLALPTEKFEKQGMPITAGLAGTPSYMAPEMADLSLAPTGPAADIYLLGAQLFRAVTKVAPHTGKHAYAALQAAAVNRIQWPDDETAYDEELLAIARKAMATRPEDRYESALAFKQALRDYRSHSESRRLTEAAREELASAEETSNYRSFERAVASLEEAIKLWPENDKASKLLQTARLRYAQAAYQKGDLDLAEGQLDDNVGEHRELLQSIRETRLEREAQAKRLRRMKQTAASLAAVVFLTVSVSAVLINSARTKEKLARQQETIAKSEAVQRFRESQVAIAELSGLADSLRDYPLAQAERKKLLQAVTSYYDRQTREQSNVPELRFDQVQSLIRLGEVQNQLAEYSKAIKTWDQAEKLAANLNLEGDVEQATNVLMAKITAGRAQSFFAQGDVAEARLWNVEAATLLSDLSVEPEDEQVLAELAAVQLQQALFEKSDGRYEFGLSLANQAIDTLQHLSQSRPDAATRKELAIAHGIRSQIQELNGDYDAALASTGNARSLWNELTRENIDNVEFADGLATSQIDSANIQRAAGTDPLADYMEAVATFQGLVELRPGIPRYRFNLASALSGLAWTQNRILETEAAQQAAVEAVNTLLFLSQRFPEDARFPLGEVSARLILAEVLRDRGEFALAVGILEQASDTLSLEIISRDLPPSRERYGELLLIFGQVQSALGDSELAQNSLRQSTDVLTELAESESGLPRHRDSAAWALYYLAIELTDDDEAAARRSIESAIELRNELPERANWLDSFAWLLLQSPIEDLRDIERAESLAASAVKLAPENPRFRRTLALSQLRLGRIDDAAATLAKTVSTVGSTHAEHQFLLATVAFHQNRQQEAINLMTQAIRTAASVAPANPRLIMIRQEAESTTGIVMPVSEDGKTESPVPTN